MMPERSSGLGRLKDFFDFGGLLDFLFEGGFELVARGVGAVAHLAIHIIGVLLHLH
jgi:hypothetical protein